MEWEYPNSGRYDLSLYKNKQPERLYVFESGMIVNKTKEGFFNQMSGKTINGYFVDGKIDYMRVKEPRLGKYLLYAK